MTGVRRYMARNSAVCTFICITLWGLRFLEQLCFASQDTLELNISMNLQNYIDDYTVFDLVLASGTLEEATMKHTANQHAYSTA